MDNEKDKFIEIVKEKLTNYTLPVDDDSWDKISERLNSAPRKNIHTWWIASIAAAAGIALFLLLFPVDKNTPQHETANQVSGNKEKIIRDLPQKETVKSTSPQTSGHPAVFRKLQPVIRLAENNLTNEVIAKKEIANENPPVQAKKEESKTVENRPVAPNSNLNFREEEQMPVIKHKKQKSIRFSFGSGANSLAENVANTSQIQLNSPGAFLSSNMGYSLFAAPSQTKNILSIENYPDMTCHIPLSFGVTVKKELNRTFAIESGIVYTFLSTSFYRGSYPISNADLQLHYLGIPLNLHTRIFKDRLSRWEMYVSTGGMVEKGILSHFVQKTHYDNVNNAVETIVSNEKINGLQWSVGISPGIDYQIYKNYSIYVEPKLNYYFDNGQPVSARTEHPVSFGINAGIRYSW